MITEVYIAGEIKKAVYKKENKYFVLEQSSDGNYLTSSFDNLESNAFSLANPEIDVIKDIHWQNEQIQAELDKDIKRKDALNLFLMGMDTSLSNSLRKEAMELLLQTLSINIEINTFISNRVFATRIPDSFDAISAYKIAELLGKENLIKLYKDLADANNIIIEVRNAWKKAILKHDLLSNELSLEFLDKIFTDQGIFHDFVFAIFTSNYKDIDKAIVQHSDKLSEIKINMQPALFLLQIKELLSLRFPIIAKTICTSQLIESEDEDIKYVVVKDEDFKTKIISIINKFKGKSQRKKERKKWVKIKLANLSNYFNKNVNQQVEWVKKQVLHGNINNAHKGILKLIEFQDLHSDKEHLCKSLCDIAESYQKINDIDSADLITRIAKELNPEDPVPQCILAENFRAKMKLNEALNLYNKICNNFKNDVFALSGKAETLRQMGRLDEALKTYEETIKDFKNEVVPRSGKAETLRQMGRLDEALKTYEEIIKDFKNDVVPRSGKAETLR
ncbi:MAG: tetratricopeptide repeat protein, partial [Bacteroidetes bacterium]|nr:tetratricopeptide repeat protein [Bacteroidota bacterium]